MQTLPDQTQILIVGAGPAGLALAISLAQKKIPFVLIDRNSGIAPTSRAAVVHARTLEMLEPLGVTNQLLAKGLKGTGASIQSGASEIVNLSLARISSAYNYALLIPQNETEEILEKRLNFLGCSVIRNVSFKSSSEADGHVVSQLEMDGATIEIKSDYVIGCDGYHSAVREAAGISYEGGDYQESFLLADVEMKWDLPKDKIIAFLASEGLFFIAPFKDDRYRVIATVDDAPEQVSLSFVRNLMDQRGPYGSDVTIKSVNWSSRFHIHHRLVKSFIRGRIILCGDAAHVHSPAGGQGMNLGIQDAITLGRILPYATSDQLQEWADSRRTVAKRIVSMTDRMTRMITLQSPTLIAFRNLSLRIFNLMPMAKYRMARTVAQLDLPG